MGQLKLTGFGKEYTEKSYYYRGSRTVGFKEAANMFVNGLLIELTGAHLSKDKVVCYLKDGTVFSSIELRLVSSLPTPSETTPGLYNVRDIGRPVPIDFKVRITRTGTQLLIETTGFSGCIIAGSEFSEKLKDYLGVK